MNILWDFRLFSFGYARRGVGVYTTKVAQALIPKLGKHRLFVWCQPEHLPPFLREAPVELIAYRPRGWKSDLFTIPAFLRKFNIDLMHYWIAMGPLFYFGMGAMHRCPWIATVYDLAAASRNDPFLTHVRGTWYWRVQRAIISRACTIMTISDTTADECRRFLPEGNRAFITVYPPFAAQFSIHPRKPFFVALAGDPRKNLRKTLEGFIEFSAQCPDYRLLVLGAVERQEMIFPTPRNVFFEAMHSYHDRLGACSGFLFCSTYEGLGLPALEAMARGCPVICSDLPCFHETLGDAAVFVNPDSAHSIAAGMHKVADDHRHHAKAIRKRMEQYCRMSADSIGRIEAVYTREP